MISNQWVDNGDAFVNEDEKSTAHYSHSSDVWLRIKTDYSISRLISTETQLIFYKCSVNKSQLIVYYLTLMAKLETWCIITAGHSEWFVIRGCCVGGEMEE